MSGDQSRDVTVAHTRTYTDNDPHLGDIRRTCLALPETIEVEAWGRPTFRVASKMFAIFTLQAGEYLFVFRPDSYERPALTADPRVRLPKWWGSRGWLGLVLDDDTDHGEIAELAETSYRQVAPKRLIAGLAE